MTHAELLGLVLQAAVATLLKAVLFALVVAFLTVVFAVACVAVERGSVVLWPDEYDDLS